jgi:hypothetical protein
MTYYRIYELDHSKHIGAVHPVICTSDAEAIQVARRFTDRAAVEVWAGIRLVARFEHQGSGPCSELEGQSSPIRQGRACFVHG